ncbi:MAG: hypothetical protein GY765_10480 [bacterium]|nr:hypothetical protein [bacterium]
MFLVTACRTIPIKGTWEVQGPQKVTQKVTITEEKVISPAGEKEYIRLNNAIEFQIRNIFYIGVILSEVLMAGYTVDLDTAETADWKAEKVKE